MVVMAERALDLKPKGHPSQNPTVLKALRAEDFGEGHA
jgi:hypothetical protein